MEKDIVYYQKGLSPKTSTLLQIRKTDRYHMWTENNAMNP